jgi:hypothetical protein
MNTCKGCFYFNLVNKITSSGRCRVEPKEEPVASNRSACRFYKDKNNFLESYDEEILIESKGE